MIGNRSTNLDFWLKQQEGRRNWKGTVWCILQGVGTYNSRKDSCYLLYMGQGFWQKRASGRLLGLLPIRSTDEGTEESEDGELLAN